MYRFQIVAFGSVAIVFAVIGVNQSIFSGVSSLNAIAAGWLILAMVDILWVLYFTSEEDSLSLYLFNSLGTGGLSPPSRRRRTRTTSLHNPASYGGGGGYTAAGIGPGTYDTKLNNSFVPEIGGSPLNNMNVQPTHSAHSQKSANSVGPTSPGPTPTALGADTSGPQGVNSPLMSTPGNAGIGAGGGPPLPADTSVTSETSYPYKAKALYACACHIGLPLVSSLFTEDLPQIPRRQMTPTRSHSQRARFWILSIRMENGGRHGRRTAHLGVRYCHLIALSLFTNPYPSRAVELSASYLMDHRMRRTPLPSSFSLVAHDISLLFFPCLLTRGLDLVTTLSTNACSNLGLLHYIFLFLEIAICIATDGRKMNVVCCGRSLDILPVYTHIVFSPRQGALPRIALPMPARRLQLPLRPPPCHSLPPSPCRSSYPPALRTVQAHAAVCMCPI
jgi:hypothetical protein